MLNFHAYKDRHSEKESQEIFLKKQAMESEIFHHSANAEEIFPMARF